MSPFRATISSANRFEFRSGQARAGRKAKLFGKRVKKKEKSETSRPHPARPSLAWRSTAPEFQCGSKRSKNQCRKKRSAKPPFEAWLQQFANARLRLYQISSRWAKAALFLTMHGNGYFLADAVISHRSSYPCR